MSGLDLTKLQVDELQRLYDARNFPAAYKYLLGVLVKITY